MKKEEEQEEMNVSYMRSPYPLRHFKGESKSYVYHNGAFVEDYGDGYENNESFIELIGRFIERETGDEAYAMKIMKVLSEKLGVEMAEFTGDDCGEMWGVRMTCPKCGTLHIPHYDDMFPEKWKDRDVQEFTCISCLHKFGKQEWLDGIYDIDKS